MRKQKYIYNAKTIIALIIIIASLFTTTHALTADYFGEYKRESKNEIAKIVLENLKNGKVHVTGTSLWGTEREYGPNIGELDFISEIKNGAIIYSEKVRKNTKYTINIIIKKDKLIVKEKNAHYMFGLNVEFKGQYIKR